MKYLTGIVALFAMAVLVSPVLAQDASFPIMPDPVGPGNSGPDVYLAARFFDLGVDIDGSGSSINPSDVRPGFYAFTGERIIYYVLVRDLNGVDDINIVRWVKSDYDQMGPCDPVMVYGSGSEAYFTVANSEEQIIEIDEATNLQYDSQTDEVYRCELTVESNWEGCPIYVEAEDTFGDMGRTLEEIWNFNPALSVSICTSDDNPITFGETILDQDVEGATAPNCELIPNGGREDLTYRNCEVYISENEPEKKCDVSFSTNTLILTNTGIPNLWPFIAGTNFYDSTGMAKCPFTNELHANQFEYRALAGTYDSGWRIMPQYSPNLGCMGIDLGDSTVASPPNLPDLLYGQCRGGCRIPTGTTGAVLGTPGLDILVPGHSVDVRFKIVWPTPCIGNFDDGQFYTIVRAI
jgi:hypothetical protein